ncbi:MAG: hypothetical protein RLZZ15_3157 [Verrucomicrobiota bacterium]
MPAVSAPSPVPAAPPRTFWQRRVLDPILAQVKQGITPEKIALTLAVGSVLANSPFVGTMWLCLLAGVVLRLNQPIIQMINVLCTPLHLALIPAYFYWGARLFGTPDAAVGGQNSLDAMWQLLVHEPSQFAHRFGRMVFHAFVVWLIIAPVWVTVVYFAARAALRKIARVRAAATAKAARAPAAPSDRAAP